MSLCSLGRHKQLCFLHASVASAQTRYTVTDLGTLGGTQTQPNAINSSGSITGVSTPATPGVGYAFTWSAPGPIQSLGTLPGTISSDGLSINDSGWVTGGAGNEEAFLYTPQNGMRPLGFLAAGRSARETL